MNIVPMLNAQIFITNKHDSDNQSQIRNNSLYYFFVYWYSCSCRILLLIFMRYVFLHCFIQGFKLGYNILSKTLVFRLLIFHICGANLVRKGKYLHTYSLLDLNRRICILFSKSLVGQPHRISRKRCCTRRTFGKTI